MYARVAEAEVLAKGDGVFSGRVELGRWWVQKALRGATYWEVALGDGPREFCDTYAEACDYAEAQPVSDLLRRLRAASGWTLR